MRPKRFNFNQACCYDDDTNPPLPYHHSCQMSLFNSGMAVGNEPALPCLMLREIAPSRNCRPRIFSPVSAKPWCDGGNNSANYPHPTRKREVKCLRRPRSIHPELKKKKAYHHNANSCAKRDEAKSTFPNTLNTRSPPINQAHIAAHLKPKSKQQNSHAPLAGGSHLILSITCQRNKITDLSHVRAKNNGSVKGDADGGHSKRKARNASSTCTGHRCELSRPRRRWSVVFAACTHTQRG